ncbi:MAG: DUF4159 domain-containing protein [Planctomycetes bacterium]|nr:DUF4159 domain-containing protein [Planctomycetota bacterium]
MKITGLIPLAAAVIILPSVASAQRSFDFKNAKIPFSDQAIQKAIDKGAEFLLSRQEADGSWPVITAWNRPIEDKDDAHNCKIAATSMALYALMEKGMSFQNEKIAKGLTWLANTPEVIGGRDSTYCVAFRTQVWLRAWKQAMAADKTAAAKFRKSLETDVAKFIREKDKDFVGGYFYSLNTRGDISDPSNSQYGLLAVWAGYRGNMEIPKDYWDKVMKWWITRQKPDGGWGYEGADNPSYTMTAAGIASLFVCIDALKGQEFIKCSAQTEFAPIEKGLKWYDANFKEVITTINPGGGQQKEFFYGMYGIERIGLASGYKYFGDADWYKLGSIRILNVQAEDGSWTSNWGPDVASAYALLFLIRGQHGVLFNRLEYDGDWNNRPRALANFCRWAEGVYEQEVNWQIITLKSEVGEWHDAPVVTLSGSKAPKFTDGDIAKLRTYVNQGGTLFSMNECGGGAFGGGMRAAYKKIFPKYELTAAGREHPIFMCQYKLPGAPAFHIVSNGIRPLAIHTDIDLPVSWQTYAVATGRVNFEDAANVLMYDTDKQIKNRASKVWPEEPARSPSKSLKAARIRYAGNYDPEPLALQRLNRLMSAQHDLKLDLVEAAASAPASAPAAAMPETGISPSDLTDQVKIAFMTGTGGFTLNQQDKDALKKWVDGGGLLVMDAAGSAKGFTESAKNLIAELWGADSLLPLPLDSPVYQLKDMTIDKVKYRRVTLARIGGIREPRLMAVLAGSRPKVLFSAEDLTGGLVGYSALGMDGYDSDSACDVMRNICIYRLTAPAPAEPSTAPAK